MGIKLALAELNLIKKTEAGKIALSYPHLKGMVCLGDEHFHFLVSKNELAFQVIVGILEEFLSELTDLEWTLCVEELPESLSDDLPAETMSEEAQKLEELYNLP